MPELTEVSLETLGGGAAIERFNYELQNILNNIGDINTKADAVCVISIEVSGKLASIKPEHSSFHLMRRGDRMVATEYNPKQQTLEFPNQLEVK